ncbi:uncharacterized protein LOC117639350 [Thrips palmi]|uniref:Uncharacterized protein LOC117639350 n=1 Tax=Thrips palmi TaxID=161013 RepID=A0A6P8XV34_THRPL|nr:uncharacterized protein LOC117639350 [Thrips palmi]XP_034230819.1 uncharacterized protein LOC117639350 [Thrips palmi]
MAEASSNPGVARDVITISDDENCRDSSPKRSRKRGAGASEDPDYEPRHRSPAAAAPKRRRVPRAPKKKGPVESEAETPRARAPRKKVLVDLDSEAETPRATALPRGRKRAPKALGPEASASRSSDNGVAQLPTGWSALPHHLLTKIFSMVGNEDVISAGQSCRSWRAAAKLPSVWHRRQLSYDLPAGSKKFRNWHSGARQFARTIRFAPCLARVSCPKSLKDAARTAIATRSTCEVKSAELNGQLQWTQKYILRQKTLEDLLLLNPNVQALKTALALPQLHSLAVSYERDVTKEKYQRRNMGMLWDPSADGPRYQVPAVPSGTKGHLKKLLCHSGVGPAAVNSLVLANTATLEEVGVHCLPLEALLCCSKLRRLMVKVNPAYAPDQVKMRQLLKSRPVDYVAFVGTRSHARATCSSLRDALRKLAPGCTVVCSACHNVPVLEKPLFASRDVPNDGGHRGRRGRAAEWAQSWEEDFQYIFSGFHDDYYF